jgi:hypothetical protein
MVLSPFRVNSVHLACGFNPEGANPFEGETFSVVVVYDWACATFLDGFR